MADDIKEIGDQVDARVAEESAHLAGKPEKKEYVAHEDPRFVHDAIRNQERGDGLMFCSMHQGQYLYNKIQGRWFNWAGHYWEPDIMGRVVEGVESVALQYENISAPLTDQIREAEGDLKKAEEDADRADRNDDAGAKHTAELKKADLEQKIKQLKDERANLFKRSGNLRKKVSAEKCLWWAHSVPGRLAVRGDEFDKKPMLLACKNGVVDLETGRLHKGRPDDLLVRAIPIEYDPNAKAPDFDRFLPEIYEENEEKAKFILRYLGYSLTGMTTEQIILFFVGDGANGKGTLVELIHYLLGPLAWSINPELILEQKNPRPTAGPSADIISLYGRRLVIASETDKNRRIGAANLKRFTGGDTLIGRSPHDREETNFDPTHKMICITNDLPLGLLADFSLQRRIRLITHRLRYVDDVAAEQRKDPQNADFFRPKDGDLPRKLREQAPGILAALVRACLEYQQYGLTPPQSILDDAEEHRKSEDHVGSFLENCIRIDDDPEYRIQFKDFYKAFETYYKDEVSDNTRYIPGKTAVGKELVRKGYHKVKQGGNTWLYGVKLPVTEVQY